MGPAYKHAKHKQTQLLTFTQMLWAPAWWESASADLPERWLEPRAQPDPFPGLSLKASHPLDCSFTSSTNFLIRLAPGQAPEGPPVSMPPLCPLCTHCITCSTATAKRAPGDYKYVSCSWAKGHVYFPPWTTTWPAAKTKIRQCVFFPRNDNYSTPNIFQTSTTKMEKAFQKIIY